jgi:hypothetical protein
MRAFHCDRCGSLLFFENFRCLKCESPLAFAPDAFDMVTLEAAGGDQWRAIPSQRNSSFYRRCANDLRHNVCNWLIPVADPNELCISCRCNETIPDLNLSGNVVSWAKIEAAKRRALYNLIQLSEFPTETQDLRFRFLGGSEIVTGHENGIITLNIAEADDAERERRRASLHEPYRTLLGHFRHEIGHYYWAKLVKQTPFHASFQNIFGDETRDYAQALQFHYQCGPPADWQLNYISSYAAAHPWEDWAETWAHYLHMLDTIETAGSFGISLKPKHPDAQAMTADPARTFGQQTTFDKILHDWIPLTYVLNTLNRGMGLADLYPFVLSEPIVAKLRFVHGVLQ